MKTTTDHKKYWVNRKIDWQTQYLDTWNHPHRQMIMWALQSFPWFSLWEVGCGPGANLVRIVKDGGFGERQLGGSDINPEAIELARKTFVGGRFHVESVDDMMLTDSSVDVILSDAALIYIDPKGIKKAIAEMKRAARNHLVLCEFHSTSWLSRLLLRWKTGYHAYNYKKLLEEAGLIDVQIIKLPKEMFPGYPWEKYGHVIVAQIVK